MEKQEKRDPEKRQWVVSAFASGAALGSLYGAFILGPAMVSLAEGMTIGLSIGIGAGVSMGAVLEVRTEPEKMKNKQNKLLIAVVAATVLLVFSTALLAFSGTP